MSCKDNITVSATDYVQFHSPGVIILLLRSNVCNHLSYIGCNKGCKCACSCTRVNKKSRYNCLMVQNIIKLPPYALLQSYQYISVQLSHFMHFQTKIAAKVSPSIG